MSTQVIDLPPRAPALTFASRGPVSELVLSALLSGEAEAGQLAAAGREALAASQDVVDDDDVQLALFVLYALSYGSLGRRGAALEFDPGLLALRAMLEEAFEAALRERVEVPALPAAQAPAVAKALFELTLEPGPPALARFVARRATLEQLRELVVHRTIYTLREADPHSWAIPRLSGRAKAALVEIQSDEYGGGNHERMHASLFRSTVRGMGLDERYAAYVDKVPALTLASHNLMSMFGINGRLLGAIVGHLAAFEMTSSIPSRFHAEGFRRHGFGEDVTFYFDEHVEADAVHEQIAAHELAGSLAEDEPELLGDIMFGAAACLALDSWSGEQILADWKAGRSSLRERLA